MRSDLEERLLRVSKTMDKLAHVRHMVEQVEGTDARGHVASAAVAAAEYVAAVTGNEEEAGLIHRAYEEILAAIEGSPAIEEMLQWSRVGSHKEAQVHGRLSDILRDFRFALAGMEDQ